MSVTQEVFDEILRLRRRVPTLTGALVATLDGLLIAHDMSDAEPEGVAALAAAGLGLGQRTAAAVYHGDVRETVIRNAGGYVATFAAGPRVLLTVVATPEASLERIGIEARLTAERVTAIVEVLDVIDFDDLAPDATAHRSVTLGTSGYLSRESGRPPLDGGFPAERPLQSAPLAGPAGLPRRRPAAPF